MTPKSPYMYQYIYVSAYVCELERECGERHKKLLKNKERGRQRQEVTVISVPSVCWYNQRSCFGQQFPPFTHKFLQNFSAYALLGPSFPIPLYVN